MLKATLAFPAIEPKLGAISDIGRCSTARNPVSHTLIVRALALVFAYPRSSRNPFGIPTGWIVFVSLCCRAL